MDMELLRNGSGYVDYTAYKALSNYERTEKEMNNVYRGEIYEVEAFNSTEARYGLVVSANDRIDGRYINVIMGNYEKIFGNEIPIRCNGLYYFSPEKVSLINVNKIGNFVRLATDDEMAQIDAGIAKALGLQCVESEECEAVEPVYFPEGKAVELPFPAPTQEENYIRVPFEEFEDLCKSNTEKDIYKGLYEQLLSKLIKD